MDVLVKPTRGHRANCSLCMQMLDTLFGPEEEEEEEEEEGGGGEFDDGTGSVVSCHPRRDSAPTITIICFPPVWRYGTNL